MPLSEMRERSRWGRVRILVLVAAVTLTMVVVGLRRAGGAGRAWPELDRVAKATVRRANLAMTITAGGTVNNANRTLIECELESLEIPGKSRAAVAQGTSTILSLVPEGTMVRRGDVLCRLDASDYKELLRQQRILVEQAQAEHHQAELDLEVARMAVLEFRDGVRLQALQELEGKIALTRSEWERSADRLNWLRRMFLKGYVAAGQVAAEVVQERRAALLLSQSRIALEIYQRFSAPRTLRELESQVLAARATLDYQTARLNRQLLRRANLERQVERCTIRAPHDGIVVYANDRRRRIQIEPGIPVRPRQDLFYLPDLSRMEVSALLHESVVDQVHDGMRARVRVEGLPDRVLEGHVVFVTQVPTRDRLNQIPYFIGSVHLDAVPEGLRPGMSAEVEIATRYRDDVLTIPAEALVIEDGREVCYVAGLEGLERREVKVGHVSRDRLEVTRGLVEGDEVVLEPSRYLAALSDRTTGILAVSDAPGAGDSFAASKGETALR